LEKAAGRVPILQISEEARSMFALRWGEWHTMNVVSAADPKFSNGSDELEAIAGDTGAFAFLAAQAVGADDPMLNDARRRTQRLVVAQYPYNEWAPALGGISLMDRLNTYFDVKGQELTRKALAWDAGESE